MDSSRWWWNVFPRTNDSAVLAVACLDYDASSLMPVEAAQTLFQAPGWFGLEVEYVPIAAAPLAVGTITGRPTVKNLEVETG
nr:hypothetical protein CFP56_23800 [Quercus suber]